MSWFNEIEDNQQVAERQTTQQKKGDDMKPTVLEYQPRPKVLQISWISKLMEDPEPPTLAGSQSKVVLVDFWTH